MRSMPWSAKNAAARVRKPAQVATFSSPWISLWAPAEPRGKAGLPSSGAVTVDSAG